jgi:hypothetical protein
MHCLAMPFSVVGSRTYDVVCQHDGRPSSQERSERLLTLNQRTPCFSNI